jgi:hypothetical protein
MSQSYYNCGTTEAQYLKKCYLSQLVLVFTRFEPSTLIMSQSFYNCGTTMDQYFKTFFCYLSRQLDLNPQLRIVSLLFCYCATTKAQYLKNAIYPNWYRCLLDLNPQL